MRIMGIDPSLTGCGLVMLHAESGRVIAQQVVGTPASDPRGKRLGDIARSVVTFYREAGPPDVVAMEDYAFGSPFNRESMGEVGGIIKAALWRLVRNLVGEEGTYVIHVEPVLWPNHSWKKAVLGKGNVKKEDLKLPIFQKYGVEIADMNILEAFCVATAERLAQVNPLLRPAPKKSRREKAAKPAKLSA